MTLEEMRDVLATVSLVTPPEDQGQMLTRAYCRAPGGVLRVQVDRSEKPTDPCFGTIHFAADEDMATPYEPWNSAPMAHRWRHIPDALALRALMEG